MKNKQVNYLSYFKKYEFLVQSLIVFVFIAFLTVKLLIPNLNKAGEIRDNEQKLIKKLAVLQNKDRILLAVDSRLFADNFVKLNYVVPASKDYSLLFTSLDNLQQRLGVAITRTDFELGSVSSVSARFKKDSKADVYLIPISLEVMGTPTQLEDFIIHLTDLSGRLITVDQVKIDVESSGIVKAVLTGNTYFNPLPSEIGSVDAPIPEFAENYKNIFRRILENQFPVEQIGETYQDVPTGKENLFL